MAGPVIASEHPWLASILDAPEVRALAEALGRDERAVAAGSCGSSTHLLAGALAVKLRRPVLLVVAHLDDADDAVEDLELFTAQGMPLDVQRFAALEMVPGESSVSLELLAQRLALVEWTGRELGKWAAKAGPGPAAPVPVITAHIAALMQAVPEVRSLSQYQRTLKAGMAMPPGQLLDWLEQAGYTRSDAIEQTGDYATRGGIIDIYPPAGTGSGDPVPVRLDYFGDEIESIYEIDTGTMGSGRKIESVSLIGASAARIQTDDQTVNFLSLLPPSTVVVLHELLELSEQARGYYERLTSARGVYAPNTVLQKLGQRPHVQVNQYASGTAGGGAGVTMVQLPVRPLPGFDNEAAAAVRELGLLARHGTIDPSPAATTPEAGDGSASAPGARVTAMCQNLAEAERLGELVAEHAASEAGMVRVEVGYLHRGFIWGDDAGEGEGSVPPPLVLVPHHELFHRYHARRRIRRVTGASQRGTDAFFDIDVGDHVVHVDHGIAIFRGLRTMRREGRTEDYLTLEFASKALLHVPASQIDLVQKYIGGFQGKPPLSTLGGKRWGKQKEQTREAVKELAAELLRVQAARASMPGIRFPADTTWQKDFEAEFPYDETEDQLAAIAEIKKDMAHAQPMDRLICGDVGFGKTEVAIRAAFKAAEYGKQVAVLVPTTVLAEQHWRTFRSRMAAYPFRIAVINRFRTGSESRKILMQLARGEIDIIIGTHRLLSADVKFADLGLVIIDEEQRFGVEHKNKLLSFRLTADVLTLSATPIPRTLHMSMLGLRDISSLSMAPADRRAVVTEVVPFDEKRIRQAIVRELNREGQVYFVHNRVHNIQSMADDIHRLVPEARIVIGHGQMHGHELEEVMLKFMRREADVLVSTTIIESGIDIATANTMLINQADHFGLAELHQLRGRVGRYKHRAYCYLLLPQDRPVTETAARRLKAIEQYNMLGAGFKIAMRDLEIRGAGNLLGSEQSGHIAAVGYEMYCLLLEREATRLRSGSDVMAVRTHLELPVAGRIPPSYIQSEKYRMEAYKRISRAEEFDELEAASKDLVGAYGEPPETVRMLIDLAELRIAGGKLGIDAIRLEGPDVIFRTGQPGKLDPLLREAPGRASVIDTRTVYYRPPPKYIDPPATLLAVLRKLLVRPQRAA